MPRIVVGDSSLYPEIYVALGEKEYKVKKLNQALWDQLADIEKRLAETTAMNERNRLLCGQIIIMTGAPKKAIEELDVRDLMRIIEVVTDEIRKGPQGLEKKGLRPEEQS